MWLRYNYLKIYNLWVQKKQNIGKIAFRVVQMKSSATHITHDTYIFNMFNVGNVQNLQNFP